VASVIENESQSLVEDLRGATFQFGVVTRDSPLHRVEFDSGLTESEIRTVEAHFDFRFPADLCALLQTALPRGPLFPDWRMPESTALADRLAWPFDGIAFDIEHNVFWLDSWGPRPAALSDALAVARATVESAPRLIPIFGHRYLPAEPEAAGNPVFSVYQTDIICYGVDLRRYLLCEFGRLDFAEATRGEPRRIRFWTDIIDGDEELPNPALQRT